MILVDPEGVGSIEELIVCDTDTLVEAEDV